MSKAKRAPELRFKGFTGEWEQRKLKNFGKATGGTSIESEFVDGGKYKVISIGSYSEQSVYTDQNIRVELTDKTKNRILNKDDLTMILNDKTASGNIIGRVLLIDSNDSYVYNQRTERIEPDLKKYDSQFLYQLLNAPMIRSKIIKQAQGNTQIYVNWSSISELDYLVPSLDEQYEIGEFLSNLDTLITLHQRKLEVLKQLKQAYLQNMFPSNGKSTPRVRFTNFIELWEQRKLGDVTERVQGNDGRMDLPTLTISAGNGWLDQRERFSGNIAGKEQKNYTLLSENELSYNKGNSKLAKYGVVFKLRTYKEALVPRVYHSFRTVRETDPDYIEYMFATKLPNRELGKLVTSGARMDGLLNINYDDFMGIKIKIPSLEEQRKVGIFFIQLDNLITLHQRRLENLNRLKKSYLQKMFI